MKQELIVIMLAFGVLACAGETPAPELRRVVAAIQPVTATLSPVTEVTTNSTTSVTISHLTQTFKIHGSSMTGEFSKEAHDQVGPTFKGFSLFVQVQEKGETNQAVTPQTLRRPYWLTYLQVTPVASSDKQLFWGLSYGSRTDTNLLAKIRHAVESMGEEPDPGS